MHSVLNGTRWRPIAPRQVWVADDVHSRVDAAAYSARQIAHPEIEYETGNVAPLSAEVTPDICQLSKTPRTTAVSQILLSPARRRRS